jgi:protein-arginine kinase activator protein McsA
LTNHEDEPTLESEAHEIAESLAEGGGEGAGAGAEAKSLKCLECGKTFKNEALASYHGEKSGHSNFEESTEEIKPLTEDEKTAKLEEVGYSLCYCHLSVRRRFEAKQRELTRIDFVYDGS